MKNMFEQLEENKVIRAEERRIIQGALDLQEKCIGNIMTPLEKVFMLEISTKLDFETLKKVYSSGHSRIPVYDRHPDNIVGILMARDLILINPDKALMTLK